MIIMTRICEIAGERILAQTTEGAYDTFGRTGRYRLESNFQVLGRLCRRVSKHFVYGSREI